MKKYLVLIIVLFLLIAGLVTGVYVWLSSRNKTTSDAIQAIPTDASLLFRIEDYSRFRASLNGSKVWESVSDIDAVGDVNAVLAFIDSLQNSNALIKNVLRNNPIYISLSAEGGGNTAFLFAVRTPDGVSPSELYSIAKLQAIGLYKEEEKYFNGSLILSFKQSGTQFNNISVVAENGLLLVSSSSLLLEKSISQLEGKVSLLTNPQFQAISKTSGTKVDANIYINIKHLPALLKNSVKEKYRGGVNTLGDIAQWIELDMNLSSSNFVLSGLSNVSDSTNSYLRILTKQKPIEMEMQSVIPTEIGLFVWLGITSLDDYLEGYRGYLDRKGEIFKYTQNLSGYRKFLGTEPQEFFKGLIDREIGVVFLPIDDNNKSDEWFIITRTKSASAAQLQLQSIVANYNLETKDEVSTKPTVVKIDKDKSVEIFHLPIKGLHSLLLGSLFAPVLDEYYCFIDNWIIWGSSVEALERYVKANIRNTVLGNDNTYRQFSGELPKKSNYFIYLNPSKLGSVAQEFLDSNVKLSTSTASIKGFSYQLIGGNNLIFNIFTAISGEGVQKTAQKSLWETKLEAVPIIKPQILVNHTNKEKEIFVQDAELNIYLINNVGRILWKRKVDGSIMGDVTQVDLFKNRKLQYAFNTASKLYVVDRNGKDVSGFPVLYSSPATNPVSVIDYDGSRDYRFFQACADRKIYVYDSNGKALKGWKFVKTESTVTDRIGFARVSGLDYLIVFDANRPYLLNRKGEERVKLKQYFTKAQFSTFALGSDKKGKSFIVTTDSIGLVRNIYLDGEVEDIALQSFTRWHAFTYQDINGDGAKDYIYLDNKTLYAFDSSKEPLFQIKIKDELKPEILYFDFGGDNKIGVVSEKSGKIYLVNSKGKVEDGFPYNGSTSFSITRLTKSNNMSIIVGSKQGTLINYGLGN